MIEEINPNLTLPEKLNSIKISKRLDNYRPHSDHNKNLKLVFYIYENGKKERKDNNDDEKYGVYQFKDNENPFEENIDDKKLISKRTQLSIDFNNFNYKDPNIYFTTKFSEICDLVHFSCATHVPLVLEGDSGQGKKKAIYYVAEYLGLEIIHKVLSKSTKSDELLMNMIISKSKNNETIIEYKETDITQALKEKNSKKIIIFDEINNASLPVLDLLSNIFNLEDNRNIFLPDGTELKIGNINIIGIINRSNNESLLDRIPLNLKSNSIYHIVENPNGDDFTKIITNLFTNIHYDENSKKEYVENYFSNHSSLNEEEKKSILENKEEINKYYQEARENEYKLFAKKFIEALTIVKVIQLNLDLL